MPNETYISVPVTTRQKKLLTIWSHIEGRSVGKQVQNVVESALSKKETDLEKLSKKGVKS